MRHTFGKGIPMMEFDLRESADHTIFLSHDATLDRTTEGKGPIAAHNDKDLAKVDLLDPVSHAPVETINTFEALLSWAQTVPVALMVDLKDTPPSDAVKALRNHGLLAHAVLLTFDDKTAAAAFASDPTALVSVLVQTKPQIDKALAGAKGHPLVFYVANTAEAAVFAYARSTGNAVITDALGDLDKRAQTLGPSEYRTFLATHPVDILVTDRALELSEALSVRR